MRVLHIISDWKWTGPAEPVVSLCEALYQEGVDVRIAYRKTPIDFPERTIEKEVKKRRIPFYEGFKLNRYFSIGDWIHDICKIGAYCKKEKIEICHTHLSHDHVLSFLSLYFRKNRPLIVRTDHKRDGLEKGFLSSLLVRRTDGIVTYSERIKRWDMERFGISEEKIFVIPPGLNMKVGPLVDVRDQLGLKVGDKVIGVIGRLKVDRGYEIILKAYKIVKKSFPNAKVVIMGRSSQMEKSVLKPISELGVKDGVILAGYRIDDYYSVIDSFDIFVMMRAGTDGSARALREVMAMGKPAIVSEMGMLPEIVKDGETGFVVPVDEKALAEKMVILLRNERLRKEMGEKAKKYAESNWNYRNSARMLISFYEKLLK
jgi:glycosyltransferase involved in cell wall biosynthesis